MKTKNEEKHAPTPWRVTGTTRDVEIINNTRRIASIDAIDEADEANAAFIVRAVNAHDKLKWSADALIRVVMKYITNNVGCITDDDAFVIVKEARNALVKAEGLR